jgi:hypothetical protein
MLKLLKTSIMVFNRKLHRSFADRSSVFLSQKVYKRCTNLRKKNIRGSNSVLMKITDFWDVTCSLEEVYRCFKGT